MISEYSSQAEEVVEKLAFSDLSVDEAPFRCVPADLVEFFPSSMLSKLIVYAFFFRNLKIIGVVDCWRYETDFKPNMNDF